jgi:hypothetical protein
VDLLFSVLTDIASAGLLAVLGWLTLLGARRRLWRIGGDGDSRRLVVCVSERLPESTRSYDLRLVGYGQVQALAALVPSLSRSHRRLVTPLVRVRMAGREISIIDLESNVVMLGGASRNTVTRNFLDHVRDDLGVDQRHADREFVGDRLLIRQNDGSWRAVGGRPVDEANRDIQEDYGLVVRRRNPWDPSRDGTCVLMAGVYTFGTAAAARYFADQAWNPRWWLRRDRVALLRVTVERGEVIGIELIKNMRNLAECEGVSHERVKIRRDD